MSLHRVCISCLTNNIVEYNILIELLFDAIAHGIHHLVVRLDSQLLVLHLDNFYSVRSPTMLSIFVRVPFLEKHFNYIQYQHIPRSLNTLVDALMTHVLDRHCNKCK